MQIKKSYPSGFTLLELVLAMGIFAILATSIFTIVSSTIGLTSSLISYQEEQIYEQDFERHITQLFLNSNTETSFALEADQINQNTKSLIVEKSNSYFPHEGKDTLAKKSILQTSFNNDGLLKLEHVYFVDDSSNPQETLPPTHTTLLFDNLSHCEWLFYNTQQKEWIPLWTKAMGRPSHIKFIYQPSHATQKKTIFLWLPRYN